MDLRASLQGPDPAPPSPLAPSPYLLGLFGVAALFVVFVLPRLRRRRSSGGGPPGTFEDAATHARGELERLLAEIQDFSRDHLAKLDAKIRLLNQLLADVDRKKGELEALLSRVAGVGHSRIEPPPTARPANPLHDQVYALQDSGKNVFDICAATGLEKGEVELILGLRRMPGKI